MKKINLIVITILALSFFACKKEQKELNEDKKFELNSQNSKLISLDTIKVGPVESELKLTGKVAFDEDKVIKLFPLVSGKVQQIKVELGDYVQKGQILAVIESGEVADFQKNMIQAESNVAISKRNLDAVEDMFKSGLNSERDLITAQREYNKAEAELNKSKELMKIYNISENKYIIKSPISGYVVEKNINNEMQVRPDNTQQLFTISDLSDVWVLANVYETDIDKVHLGFDAKVITLTYPDKIFSGRVDKIYNVLDPLSKVMKIRIKLNNPGVILKPEMFASVSIYYKEHSELPIVKSESVIMNNSKKYVVVFSNNKLEAREVEVYKEVNGKSFIHSGLNPNEYVLAKYQLLFYNALIN